MSNNKNNSKVDALPIAEVEELNAQDRIARMLKKSGVKSKILEKMAGKHADV